VERSATVL